MKQVFDSLQTFTSRLDDVTTQLAANTKAVQDGLARTESLEAQVQALLPQPTVEKKIDGTSDLTGVFDPNASSSDGPPQRPAVLDVAGTASLRPAAGELGSGSMDRRDPLLHRGDAQGILSHPHTPVTGNPPLPSKPVQVHMASEEDDLVGDPYVVDTGQHRAGYHPTPKMEFPKFDGENPKVWQDECETYFEIYQVSPGLRTHFAALNFRGTAALWWRNVQAKGRVDNWTAMCHLVHEKFGKNKYVHYRRQLRALKQTGNVTEYIDKFETLGIKCFYTILP